MVTYILVLAIASTQIQHEEWSVLDSGMTIRECADALRKTPRPFYLPGVKVYYMCQMEDVN
jgi:hypothetical protein